jgi:hypothetical protein
VPDYHGLGLWTWGRKNWARGGRLGAGRQQQQKFVAIVTVVTVVTVYHYHFNLPFSL